MLEIIKGQSYNFSVITGTGFFANMLNQIETSLKAISKAGRQTDTDQYASTDIRQEIREMDQAFKYLDSYGQAWRTQTHF